MASLNAVLRLAALGTAGLLTIVGYTHAQLPITSRHIASPPARAQVTPNTVKPSRTGSSGDRRLSGNSIPTERYDHGDPTNDEQYMLEMVNRARANPAAEGERLASVDDPDISSAYDYFHINRNKLRTDFAGYPQRPPLAFNKSLIDAARRHSRDMNQNNFQNHVGSDGSQYYERMSAAGYGTGSNTGENIAAYSNSVLYGHTGLNVDWGEQNQIDLGHRTNIMNFGSFQYTEIGIGIIQNGQSLPHTGPYVITQDFGRANLPFIVGVVYRDQNANNFYDPGEGLSGVTVMPSSGTYYAVTSSSGGYAIPCAKTGSWSITASGGSLPEPTTVNVTFNGNNVKADFRPNMENFPAQVELNLPANGIKLRADNADLSWKSMAGIAGYHLQVSSDANFANDIMVDDSSLTGTSAHVDGLQNQEYYYWRVRARNAAGWGVFSQKRLIEVAMLPAPITLNTPANGSEVPAGSIEFAWSAPSISGQVDRYWFEIGPDALMHVIDMRDSMLTDPWTSVHNITTGRKLYWRVKAMNSEGWGEFSPTWSVNTSTSGVTRERANTLFRLSGGMPNPFSGSTTISFDLARAERVTLTVVDNLGNEVAVLASGPRDAGHNEVRWNAEGFESGVYYFRLRAGKFTETQAVILAR